MNAFEIVMALAAFFLGVIFGMLGMFAWLFDTVVNKPKRKNYKTNLPNWEDRTHATNSED